MMEFSIIIPTYNDWDRLEKCLDPLRNPAPGSPEYEIIVVDNAPVHTPPDAVLQMPDVILVHESIPGSYAARNRGAKMARGRYLAFTDSDCIPGEDWIQKGLPFFEQSGADLIGGRIDLFRENGTGEWAYIYEEHMAFRQSVNVPKGQSVTANLMVRKEVFDTLGGFNPGIKSGGDFEFCLRTVRKGYKLVYADNVVVKHPSRKNVRNLFKKQKRFSAWGYLNVKNQYGHSGIRIFGSNLYNGFKAVFRKSSMPIGFRQKMVIFCISLGLYLYMIWLQLLIMLNIIDPKKIRE